MNKKINLSIVTFFLLVLLFHSVLAEDQGEEGVCISNYECGPWSGCVDSLQSRTCTDTACSQDDITERTFCETPGERCTPKIECDSWSICEYTGRIDKIFEGKIGFGGAQSRVCRDANKCGISSFYQYRQCSDEFELKLSPGRECDQNILRVIDPGSDQTIAKINLDRWEQNKLDLSFVQGERQYCPSCYDTTQNNDEEGIDCGGSCRSCRHETTILRYLTIMFLWSGSAVFTALSLRNYIALRKLPAIFVEGQ